MREIKFRGREVIGNQRKLGGWFFGDLVHYCGGYERTVDDEITPVVTEICIECADCLINVDPSTVGQFPGLKDSAGKEIYEGDILRYLPPWRWVDTKRIGVVVFQDYGFRVKNEYVTDSLFNIAVNSDGARFEVIGNIHDNPELLRLTKK